MSKHILIFKQILLGLSIFLFVNEHSLVYCSHEQRIQAMHQLMKMTRDNCAAIWDDHFKTILLLLLETLGDNDVRVRVVQVLSHCFVL